MLFYRIQEYEMVKSHSWTVNDVRVENSSERPLEVFTASGRGEYFQAKWPAKTLEVSPCDIIDGP